MKTFLSILDSGCADIAPQNMQHLVIGDFARQLGGKVTFYTAEDFLTLSTQSVFKAKLSQKPEVDGMIFFRLQQFCYGGTLNYDILKQVLCEGYAVHLARERLSLTSLDDLIDKFDILFGSVYSLSGALSKPLHVALQSF
jgi:hypothetical protein